MRKAAIIAGGIVVLLIVVLLVAPLFVDANAYRGRIEAELDSRLGRQVTLGGLHLHLLPLNFKADNITIGEDAAFPTGKAFATAGQLSVSPRLGPLLHGQVEVTSLELTRPVVELVRNPQGTWNFSSLGGNSAEHRAPEQPPSDQNNKPFELGSLIITDGQVAIDDQQHHQPRAVYDHIDLKLRNFSPHQPFDVDLGAHLPGPGAETLSFAGTAGPIGGETALTPFNGKLELKQVSLAALRKFANASAPGDVDGSLSGQLQLQNRQGALNSTGSFTADKVLVNGAALGQPLAADYKLTGDMNSELLTVNDLTLKVGSTPFHLAGAIDLKPTPAALNLHFTAADAPLEQVGALMAAFGAPLGRGTKLAGRVNCDVQVSGPSAAPEFAGKIAAQNAAVQGIPHPISIKQLALQLAPHAAGAPAGRANEMARMLNGNVNLDLEQGQIGNMDLLGEAARAGQFLLGNRAAQSATSILKLTGNLNLVNGVGTTNDLKAVLAEGPSAGATGTIDVVKQLLNLHVTAVLPQALTQKLGGAGSVGGLMRTALANANGELVVPLIVTGSFDDPHFAPDLERMAQMRLHNLAPTLNDPAALSSGIAGALGGKASGGGVLGGVLGSMGQPQSQKKAAQPNDLNNALNSILGKKKPPRQ